MGLKKSALFITIMDFVVFLILIVAVSMVPGNYDGTSYHKRERAGRYTVSIGLGLRFVQSVVSEWYRQTQLKEIFLDIREAFKLFIVARYIFVLGVFVPMVFIANQYLLFEGSLSGFLFVFLLVYEGLILIIAISKIATSKIPLKLAFINLRYGH